MKQVETAFDIEGGNTEYLDLRPEELPRVGEGLLISDSSMRGFSKAETYTVKQVFRTYSAKTHELVFAHVALVPDGGQ